MVYRIVDFNEDAVRAQKECNKKFENEGKFEVVFGDVRQLDKTIPHESIKGFAFSNELLETNGAQKVNVYADKAVAVTFLMPKIKTPEGRDIYFTKDEFIKKFTDIGAVNDFEFVEIDVEVRKDEYPGITTYLRNHKKEIYSFMREFTRKHSSCGKISAYLNPDGARYIASMAGILAPGSQFMVIEEAAGTTDLFNPYSFANSLWLAPPKQAYFTHNPGSFAISAFPDFDEWRRVAKIFGLEEIAYGGLAVLETISPKRWLNDPSVKKRITQEFRRYGHSLKLSRRLRRQRIEDFRKTPFYELVLWEKTGSSGKARKIATASPLGGMAKLKDMEERNVFYRWMGVRRYKNIVMSITGDREINRISNQFLLVAADHVRRNLELEMQRVRKLGPALSLMAAGILLLFAQKDIYLGSLFSFYTVVFVFYPWLLARYAANVFKRKILRNSKKALSSVDNLKKVTNGAISFFNRFIKK